MNLYHGSKSIITKPFVKGSNPKNDYGPAFYLTLSLNDAQSWACKNDSVGYANKYWIQNQSFQKLKVLDLTDKSKYNVLNWMAILMHFRELSPDFTQQYQQILDWLNQYYINVDDYDVVVGYRADDAYFRFPIRFIQNALALEDLEQVFLLGHLGVQYAFISPRAISLLKFREATLCENSFLGSYYLGVKEATKEFDEMINQPIDVHKTYINDLVRKEHE